MNINTRQKRINNEIRADVVEVIGSDGGQLGSMFLGKAIKLAEDEGGDLVEVGEKDGVIVTKIMDYGKFIFKHQKNVSKSKTTTKKAEVKTIRITYKMGAHDVEVKRKQSEKFADDGHPLKITLMLKGRENNYEALAIEKIKNFIESLADFYKQEGSITKSGTVFSVFLTTKK